MYIFIIILEKKVSITRDVGIQSSNPAYISSRSPSPARTPSIEERSTKRCEADADDSPMTTPELKSEKLVRNYFVLLFL